MEPKQNTAGAMSRLSDFVDALLRGYGNVLFCKSFVAGGVLLLATFLDPLAGILGLVGACTATVVGKLLGVQRPLVVSGLFGTNGLLVGLAWAQFYQFNWAHLTLFLLCAALSAVILICLVRLIGATLGLPALSVAFVVCTWMAILALRQFAPRAVTTPALLPALTEFVKQLGICHLPRLFPPLALNFFSILSSIFFRNCPTFGLLAFFVLLWQSRMGAILAAWGYIFSFAAVTWAGWETTSNLSLVAGFNATLTAIALGGVFVVATLRSFIYASLGALVAVFFTAVLSETLAHSGLQPLAGPFNIAVLILLLPLKTGLTSPAQSGLVPIPLAHVGTVEDGLVWFVDSIADQAGAAVRFAMPFYGTWKVSQGNNGRHTHKEAGAYAWDFVVVDENGKTHSDVGDRCAAFYAFGLPVLAPASGTVVKVVANVPDNVPPQMNTTQNWGNYVVIAHAPQVKGARMPAERPIYYSLMAHMMQNSVKVREGDWVAEGQAIGLCGNSGRSDEPHLHFQVQVGPLAGSLTMPVEFHNYLLATDLMPRGVPEEGTLVCNFSASTPDILSSLFPFAAGRAWKYLIHKGSHAKVALEEWKVGVRFSGEFELVAEQGGRKRSRAFAQMGGMLYFSGIEGLRHADTAIQPGFGLDLLALGTGTVPLEPKIPLRWDERHSLEPLLPWWRRQLPFDSDGAAVHRFTGWELVEVSKNAPGAERGMVQIGVTLRRHSERSEESPTRKAKAVSKEILRFAQNDSAGTFGSIPIEPCPERKELGGSAAEPTGQKVSDVQTPCAPVSCVVFETEYFHGPARRDAQERSSPAAWVRKLWLAPGIGVVKGELRHRGRLALSLELVTSAEPEPRGS